MQRTRELVMRYGWNSASYQIVNRGIQRWFSQSEDAVVGYVDFGGYRIVAGAPVCALDRLSNVLAEFDVACRAEYKKAWYFCAGGRLAEELGPLALHRAVVLGAEPVWQPQRFLEIMQSKASLRAQCARARNKGVWIEQWDTQRAARSAELEHCLQRWLATRKMAPLHFLVEARTLDRLWDRKLFVARSSEGVVGFSVLSPIVDRSGWLVEQNVRIPEAPNGTIELLLLEAARVLVRDRAQLMSLGLAPLSAHTIDTNRAAWIRWLFHLLRHGAGHWYNFRGLDAFKSKFEPERWDPVYAISARDHCSPAVLHAIAGAFVGASPIIQVLKGKTLR